MLGDNIYGGQGPQDLVKKFSQPYKALLDVGVKFYASLGNHDDPANVQYPLWNMGGQRYYTLRDEKRPVLRARQQQGRSEGAGLARECLEERAGGLEDLLFPSSAVFGWRHARLRRSTCACCSSRCSSPMASTSSLRATTTSTNASRRRKGIYYFVEGAAGQLRKGDTRRSAMTAMSFDQDQSFMLVEIDGNKLSFQAISRTGADRRFRDHSTSGRR